MPLLVNHPSTALSAVAAASIRPSGPANVTPDTPAWVGVNTLKDSSAVAASHPRTSPSGLPAATHRPSALNAMLVHGTIRSVRPRKVVLGVRVEASQPVTSPLRPAVVRDLPSGLKVTAARTLGHVSSARA